MNKLKWYVIGTLAIWLLWLTIYTVAQLDHVWESMEHLAKHIVETHTVIDDRIEDLE